MGNPYPHRLYSERLMSYKVLVVSSEPDEKDELLSDAWGLIANAWDVADSIPGWKKAAEKWRKNWFESLPHDDSF